MNTKSSEIVTDAYMHHIGEDSTSDSCSPSETQGELENIEAENYITSDTTGDLGDYLYRFMDNYDILRDADLGNPGKNNAETIKYVRLFVSMLQNVLLKNRINIRRSLVLPPLKFRWLEDNSALIEWNFEDFRIGFSIEPDKEESGWYLVSNDNLQELSLSGVIQFDKLEPLVVRLLNFASANS